VPRYDPRKHHRRSIRMRGYEYAQPGAYFVTICTHNRECMFDDPVLRRVVETHWRAIPRHGPHVALDAWVVMPNHVHGIIVIVGEAFRVRCGNGGRTASGEGCPTEQMPFGECLAPTPAGTPTRCYAGVVGRHCGQFQIGDHTAHQPHPAHARCTRMATQLLRTHCARRTGSVAHPPIHPRQSRALARGHREPRHAPSAHTQGDGRALQIHLG